MRLRHRDAIVFGGKKSAELEAGKLDVFNVAPDGGTTVRFMAEELVAQLGSKVGRKFPTAPPPAAGRATCRTRGWTLQ